MESFVFSVALVLATGLVSLGVAWQQNRFAERRAMRERADAVEDARRGVSAEHALVLHRTLVEIGEIGRIARITEAGLPEPEEFDSLMVTARERYLLIADGPARSAVADGLTVVASPHARGVTVSDWQEAASTSAFVLAAYIRNDPLPATYVARLRELRLLYATDE